MTENRTIRFCAAVFALLICAGNTSAPALAKPKLQSATLIQLYKKHCLADLKELQGRLRAGKIMTRGTGTEAYKSAELACPFNKENPTIKQLGNARWVAETDGFVAKAGVKTYVIGARQAMAVSMKQSRVLEILARAPKAGLSEDELKVIGNIMRASAFTEANIEAVFLAYQK
jgi:hypothetical protein